MKAKRILFVFLCIPFVVHAMDSLDKCKDPKQISGSSVLLSKIKHELERYSLAKVTIEELQREMSTLKVDATSLAKILDHLPGLSDDTINNIMVDLYIITQMCSNNPQMLSNQVSIAMQRYLNY